MSSPTNTREQRVFIVFRQLCNYRLPHLAPDDTTVMLQILDCDTMDSVWNYAVGPFNRPHFKRLIKKLQSLADYIVETAND